MSEDFSTAKPGLEWAVLDGVWLRRERERIAIGRRQVADRLGLPVGQVIRVEINKRPVPPDWFAALSRLGFPVPTEILRANANRPAPSEVSLADATPHHHLTKDAAPLVAPQNLHPNLRLSRASMLRRVLPPHRRAVI